MIIKNHTCKPLRVKEKILVFVRYFHQEKNFEDWISSSGRKS
jgi:hypothetical protein